MENLKNTSVTFLWNKLRTPKVLSYGSRRTGRIWKGHFPHTAQKFCRMRKVALSCWILI
jgi:hypothetical protein